MSGYRSVLAGWREAEWIHSQGVRDLQDQTRKFKYEMKRLRLFETLWFRSPISLGFGQANCAMCFVVFYTGHLIAAIGVIFQISMVKSETSSKAASGLRSMTLLKGSLKEAANGVRIFLKK